MNPEPTQRKSRSSQASVAAPVRTPAVTAALMMLAAVALFSLMDAGLKQLSTHYPPFQVAAMRGASSLPFVVLWAVSMRGAASLRPKRWSLHLLRGVLGIAMMASFVYALRTLPLSTAYAIFFIAPLLVTALSVPLLGERVGPRRWTAIVVGLVGVVVVLRPTGEGLGTWASLAVLLSAAMYSISAITVRILARTDTTEAMMVWLLVLMALGSGLLALPDWAPIRMGDGGLILGIGIAGALGQYTITEAFRRGEASLIAPLEYTALVWGVLLDLTLWGVLPDAITWIGAAIIIGSGLYLLRRERVHVAAEHP